MSNLMPVDDSIKFETGRETSEEKNLTEELLTSKDPVNPIFIEELGGELNLSQRNILYWQNENSKVSPKLISSGDAHIKY